MLGCKNLRDLRSVVIFVKYREVSTRMILPNSSAIAETALYSRFGSHNGGVGRKGEKRKRMSSI